MSNCFEPHQNKFNKCCTWIILRTVSCLPLSDTSRLSQDPSLSVELFHWMTSKILSQIIQALWPDLIIKLLSMSGSGCHKLGENSYQKPSTSSTYLYIQQAIIRQAWKTLCVLLPHYTGSWNVIFKKCLGPSKWSPAIQLIKMKYIRIDSLFCQTQK